MLRTWKEASVALFRAVEHVTSYRRFLIVGDDGSLDLQAAEPPADATSAFPDDGDFYKEGHLLDAVSKLRGRSLPSVITSIISGDYCGVGAGASGEHGRVYNRSDDTPRLLPTRISKVRKVRLFKKMNDKGAISITALTELHFLTVTSCIF